MRESPVAVIADGSTGNIVPAISDTNGINRLATDCRITGSSGLSASVSKDGAVNRLSVDVRGSGVTAAQMVISPMSTSTGVTTINTAVGTTAAPVRFSYGPSSGQTSTVTRLSMLCEGTNYAQNGVSFCGGPALTNGIQIGAIISGVTYVFCTLKTNEDIISFSQGATVQAAPGGTLLGLSLGTIYAIQLLVPLAQPLVGANGDMICLWVRDNMTTFGNNLFVARGTCQGYLTS